MPVVCDEPAEPAEAIEMSLATVKRDWAFACAWLNRELGLPEREAKPPGKQDSP